jgi:transcriptional regulator
MKGVKNMNRLKELRQEKKLSQKELAENIGVHYRTLQNWENEESQIKQEKAQQLADYFGVSVGYLLGYEDDSSLIKALSQKVSKMSGEEVIDFTFSEEGELLSELMYQAELKKEKQNNKKFRNFVKFLKTNIIVLNDEEIENFFNMLLTADLNSGKKKKLFEKVVDEDFNKAVDFLENNGYTIFFDKSYNDD